MRRTRVRLVSLALACGFGAIVYATLRPGDRAGEHDPPSVHGGPPKVAPRDRLVAPVAAATAPVYSHGGVAPSDPASATAPVALSGPREPHAEIPLVVELTRASDLGRIGEILHELDGTPGWVRANAWLLGDTALDDRAPIAARTVALDLLGQTDELDARFYSSVASLAARPALDPELRDAALMLLARIAAQEHEPPHRCSEK